MELWDGHSYNIHVSCNGDLFFLYIMHCTTKFTMKKKIEKKAIMQQMLKNDPT